jgi:ubiquinone/menaquinone biosynthesis C-methylase UbiE
MFICPVCDKEMILPTCMKCGHCVSAVNGIWQFSNDPDLVIEGEDDKYLGYESIGENYSGIQKYAIDEKWSIIAEKVSSLTNNGVFFDLACGDGIITLPVARHGTKIISVDISNSMLLLLKDKASKNKIDLNNVTLCRMNAYNLFIGDQCIDVAVANSMLHLMSNPEKVISEIGRTLKKNGYYICFDDQPGGSEKQEDNANNIRYHEIFSEVHRIYWDILMRQNIYPTKYSWNFDRDKLFSKFFSKKEEIILPYNKRLSIKMKDYDMPRFISKGYSQQILVPRDAHKNAINNTILQIKNKYGNDFEEEAQDVIESDIKMTLYRK